MNTLILEYELTKKNVCRVVDKLFQARHNIKIKTQGKGKQKLILQEPTEYDNVELFDSAMQILEYVANHNIPVEEHLGKFAIEEEQRQVQT